ALPYLGSRTNIYLWQQNHITQFALRLDTINSTNRQYYSYSPVLGDLRTVMANKLQTQLNAFVTQSDVGKSITVWVGMTWPVTETSGYHSERGIECEKTPFTVQFDNSHNVIIPSTTLTSWPLNWYI